MDSVELDRRYLWHPFTQMHEWSAVDGEPVVIVEGEGVILRDQHGREYLDGNSSIWTNLHGHRRAEIDRAIVDQLGRIAHSSFLGLTNEVAPRLARELVKSLNVGEGYKVFLSDDGSTAIEAGLKMIFQARMQRGETHRRAFVSLAQGYHGDTIGAMSAGHSALFHRTYRPLLFETREAMAPICYRCPFNRAPPERGVEARQSRCCEWECVGELEKALDDGEPAAALVMEPRVQGAGGMAMQPEGYLRQAASLCANKGVWLMLDEVLTGFGRTGAMYAFQKEEIVPDVIALAKGMSGGYLPIAATVASAEIFEAFLGDFSDLKTFFHGHSYSGNALGCAAALANLEIFNREQTVRQNEEKGDWLARLSARFWQHPNVGDVRREGMILAVEIVRDFETRGAFAYTERVGHRICEAAKKCGLLTRPIADVVVLMPPYCVTEAQLGRMVDALWEALCEVLGPANAA